MLVLVSLEIWYLINFTIKTHQVKNIANNIVAAMSLTDTPERVRGI